MTCIGDRGGLGANALVLLARCCKEGTRAFFVCFDATPSLAGRMGARTFARGSAAGAFLSPER